MEAEDAEEAAEMNSVISENEETMYVWALASIQTLADRFYVDRKAQEERILLLKHALEAKMGFDPTNSHYGVEENRAIINSESTQIPPPPAQVTTAPPVNGRNGTTDVIQENGAGEGMYL